MDMDVRQSPPPLPPAPPPPAPDAPYLDADGAAGRRLGGGAAAVLDRWGAVRLPRLLNRSLCADLLAQVEGWPPTPGTSTTTRQPGHRRHRACR